MSRSEEATADAATAITLLQRLAAGEDIAAADLQSIVSAVTRLYATTSSRAGRELPPLDPNVSTTDALTLACALLRSQDLTPFDMAMWFSRGPHQA
jgi:hypothetical protein